MVNTHNFIELDNRMARKIMLASAACRLTSQEFVQIAVESALDAAVAKEPRLALVLEYEDERQRQPA